METLNIFTEEAKRSLEKETRRMAEELREEAYNEALRSRGEPVEVTATDVRKATLLFVKREAAPRYPMTRFTIRIYIIVGTFMFFGGLAYPFIRPLFETNDLTIRTSLYVAIMGFILVAVGLITRYLLDFRLKMKSRERLEAYLTEKIELKSEEKKDRRINKQEL